MTWAEIRASSSRRLFIGGAVFGALVVAVTLGWRYYRDSRGVPSGADQSAATEAAPASAAWNPEIAVNEYWDYGTLNGLKLYVNNTDRNVIYALDPETGKIVWQFWGQDHGFGPFEIRTVSDLLFVSAWQQPGEHGMGIWVIDGEGRLAWQQSFTGYLDMPQMVQVGETVVLENRSSSKDCLKGCGILCQENPTRATACTTHEMYAFDLHTGAVKWVNRTPNFYGHYNELIPGGNGNFISRGGGWGGFHHTYTVDITTGEILTHVADLYDNNRDGGPCLSYDQNAKTVSYFEQCYHRPIDVPTWTLRERGLLPSIVAKHADVNGLDIYMLGETLLVHENQADGSVASYLADLSDANVRSVGTFDAKHYRLDSARAQDGVIIFEVMRWSTCLTQCATCEAESFICFDRPVTEECKSCRAAEESVPGYAPMQIWGMNEADGEILWRWQRDGAWSRLESTYVEDAVVVKVWHGNDFELRSLDLLTGAESAYVPPVDDDIGPEPTYYDEPDGMTGP